MKEKKDSVQKLFVPDIGGNADIQPYFLASDGEIDKSIIDNLDSDVILLDRDLNIVLMNKAAEKTCGVSFHEVKGTNYMALRLKSLEQELSKNLNNVLQTKKTFNIDVRTTMIYTHTIKIQTIKEVKSPLDF